MKILLCFLKRGLMGLVLGWAGFNPAFASNQSDDVASFAMYSYTPIPVKASGSAILPEGEVVLPTVPSYIKQAILSPKTINPFKTVYRSIYQPAFLKQLQGCPFIGMPYELDGNGSTKEWVVITLFYGCVKQYNNYIASQPHNWILQQDAKKQFRVLMESDGRSLLAVKGSPKQKNYDKLITDHYIVNFAPTAQPQCGRVVARWVFRQNRYQLTQSTLEAQATCESLFNFGSDDTLNSPEDRYRKKNEAKARKAIEKTILPWVKQLKALH